MHYRREIDGLRAIAVLPVILFHAGFSLFSGGFVGVDVFFVISGYLITGLILADLKAGEFSITRFYERRARRILPALFLVMAVSALFAWLWLIPHDMKEFGQSASAVSLFVSNVLFYKTTGYFATGAELKPLLHTWSLSVEEQYYVIFPVLTFLLWKYRRNAIPAVLTLLLAASFVYAERSLHANPSAAFFLLPSRAWELMVGALLAYYTHGGDREALSSRVRQWGAIVGIALITAAIFLFDDGTPFPGFYALVPTLGAALILLCATPDTLVGRLLGSKAFVGIGLISYSAYLWHQPLFAFARHRLLNEPSAQVYGLLSVTALVLAWLSWRYVEQPFRRKGTFNRNTVFGLAATGTVAFLTFGLMAHTTSGYYLRTEIKAQTEWLERAVRVNQGLGDCQAREEPSKECETGDAPEVLLWGDSYAMHLMNAIQAAKPGIKVVQMTKSGCGPIPGMAPVTARGEKWGEGCIRNNDLVLDYIARTKSLKYVIVSSRLQQYLEQVQLRNGEVVDGTGPTLESFLSALRTIQAAGIKPVVVSPPPQNGEDLGRCLIKASMFGQDPALCDFPLSQARAERKEVIDFLERVSREFKVIWLSDFICKEGLCRASMENTFIYRDKGHLSREGSALLGRQMHLYDL